MQKTDRAIDKLSQDANISKTESAQILASVGSPELAKFVTGLSASSVMESSSASHSTIAKAKEISKDFNFEENARTAFQASEHLSKTSSDDHVKSLAHNQQASLSEAAHQHQSAHKHIENAKRLSKEADYTESHSASINRNYNDKLIQYIADHEAPNVGGKIGAKNASGIILRNDDETQAYLDYFMRDHAPKLSFSTSQAHFQKEYEGIGLTSTVDKNSVDHFHQQSKNHINHDISDESQGIENRVKRNIEGANQFIKNAQEDVIYPARATLQKEHDRQSTNVGIVAAVKGGISAAKNTLDSPYNFVSEKVEDVIDVYQQYVNGPKVSPDYTNIPQMLNASLQEGSGDLGVPLTQKKSISPNLISGESQHNGRTESILKSQERGEESQAPNVIKIKDVSMKIQEASGEKLEEPKLLRKENY